MKLIALKAMLILFGSGKNISDTNYWYLIFVLDFIFSFISNISYLLEHILKTMFRFAEGCIHDIRVYNQLGCDGDLAREQKNISNMFKESEMDLTEYYET